MFPNSLRFHFASHLTFSSLLGCGNNADATVGGLQLMLLGFWVIWDGPWFFSSRCASHILHIHSLNIHVQRFIYMAYMVVHSHPSLSLYIYKTGSHGVLLYLVGSKVSCGIQAFVLPLSWAWWVQDILIVFFWLRAR